VSGHVHDYVDLLLG